MYEPRYVSRYWVEGIWISNVIIKAEFKHGGYQIRISIRRIRIKVVFTLSLYIYISGYNHKTSPFHHFLLLLLLLFFLFTSPKTSEKPRDQSQYSPRPSTSSSPPSVYPVAFSFSQYHSRVISAAHLF